MKIKQFIKTSWEINKTYTVTIATLLICSIIEIINGRRLNTAIDLLFVYCFFNEIRYKHDNKTNFKN